MLNSNKMAKTNTNENNGGKIEIFCRYITRKGKKIYRKDGGLYHFWVERKK
jgi:hypothetical protein